MKSKIPIGVIGFGYWGSLLARNFKKFRHCKVKYICDINSSRLREAKAMFPEANIVRDSDAIFSDPQVKGIVIAVNPCSHFELSLKALLSKKDVLVEKPFVRNLSQIEVLYKACKNNQRILMVGYVYVYHPLIQKMREFLRDKRKKPSHFISLRMGNPPRTKQFNIVHDLASHDLAILHYLFPYSRIKKAVCNMKPEFASLNIEYTNKMEAFIFSSWISLTKIRKITIGGKNFQIIFDELNPDKKLSLFSADSQKTKMFSSFRQPLEIECGHFLDCIEKRKEPLTGIKFASLVQSSLQRLGC